MASTVDYNSIVLGIRLGWILYVVYHRLPCSILDGKNWPKMKDIFGHELNKGDVVAFINPDYRDLVWGIILSFTPQKVRIGYRHRYSPSDVDDTIVYPSCVSKYIQVGEIPLPILELVDHIYKNT